MENGTFAVTCSTVWTQSKSGISLIYGAKRDAPRRLGYSLECRTGTRPALERLYTLITRMSYHKRQ